MHWPIASPFNDFAEVHQGGYGMKIRSVYLSLAGIAACAAFASAADAQAQYTVTEIGKPEASYTTLGGINNNGEIAGASDRRPFIWRNGELIDLSSVVVGSVWPEGINDLGQITGRYGGKSGGFLYTDGIVTDLGVLKRSVGSYPDDVNNLGEVVFVALIFPEDGSGYDHWSYIYRNGIYEQVPSLGGKWSRAYAINDAGVAAGGGTFKGETRSHAILYQNGQITDLGTLGGANSLAYDLNEAGYVTGRSLTGSSDHDHAFLSYPTAAGRRMIDLGLLPGSGRHSYGDAINNLNQVVGSSEVNAQTHEEVAFIYTDGAMWNLNKLIHGRDPSRGYVWLTAAHGINDNGWIIASGRDSRAPDLSKAFLLRPVAQ
jgi:probable HAF family extracellular repeat protein